MDRVNYKLKIALIAAVNLISIAVLVWVLGVKDSKVTQAQNGADNYSAVWEMTKCRGFKTAGVASTSYNLGPAEWKVTYTLGDGSQIHEQWRATGWDDVLGGVGFPSGQFIIANCNTLESNAGGIGRAGMYSVASDSSRGVSSIPTGWTVRQL